MKNTGQDKTGLVMAYEADDRRYARHRRYGQHGSCRRTPRFAKNCQRCR